VLKRYERGGSKEVCYQGLLASFFLAYSLSCLLLSRCATRGNYQLACSIGSQTTCPQWGNVLDTITRNKLLLDKAGPNGIALLAGMKGNLLPRLGITTHEYYLSDRLSAARTQSVAGRNKSEDYLSSLLTAKQ